MAGMIQHQPAADGAPRLPPGHMTRAVLLACVFPALALLAGAALAAEIFQADGAAALGAMGGFLLALFAARLSIAFTGRPMPAPRLNPLTPLELHHER